MTFLPETANHKLPDTIAEGELMGQGDTLYSSVMNSCSRKRSTPENENLTTIWNPIKYWQGIMDSGQRSTFVYLLWWKIGKSKWFPPVVDDIKLFWRKSRFPKIKKVSSEVWTCKNCEDNPIFKQNYSLTLLIAFKMAYSCCYNLVGKLDVLDFLKKFINYEYRSKTTLHDISAV